MVELSSKMMRRMTRFFHLHPTTRLFARFAGAGLSGFVVIAIFLFYAWMTALERHLTNETQTNTAKYVNAMVSHMLTREDFQSVKTGADWDIFRRKVADLFSLQEVIRVKIYSPQGDLVWTDKRELLEIAPPANRNPHLLSAIAGNVEAHLSDLKKDEHRFERGSFRTLMELYVPINLGSKDTVAGVAEIYLNVDPLYSTLRHTRWLVGSTVFGGLGLLLLISFIGLGRAVALIHKQNDELRGALKEILQANRLRKDLLAHLSEELRNPDAVKSYADLLLGGVFKDLPLKCQPSFETMRNTAAEVMSHFTRILELTRLKAGDVIPQMETVDLNALLRDIASDLRLLCGNHAVALSVELPADTITIYSDKNLLQRAIVDLVTNAIKCTVKGHITVHLDDDKLRDLVKITVADTGVGIKPEELPKIFTEFYRGDDPHLRYKSGVGLGLAIAKKCLDLLNGKIEVESVYGRGSKFSIILSRDFSAEQSALEAA